MGKKNKTMVLSIFGVALVAIVILFATGVIPGFVAVPTDESGTGTGDGQAAVALNCPSDGTTDGQLRYEDLSASTETYLAPTAYFVPTEAGVDRVTANTLATDGTYSTAVNLACGKKYQPVAVATAGSIQGSEAAVFTAAGPFKKITLVTSAVSDLQGKIKDLTTDNWARNCSATSDNSTAFVKLTNATQWNASTTNDWNVGTDGFVNLLLQVKTVTTKTLFGVEGLPVYMGVNASASHWDEPVVNVGEGQTLKNLKGTLSVADERAFSDFEYVYDVGQIGERAINIYFYIQAASGIDPSDQNIEVEFYVVDKFESALGEEVLDGAWTNAATQQIVGSTIRNRMMVNII